MIGDAEQGVLDVIAAGESPDYNTMYGGHKFTSLKDHPRIPIPLPNGKITTAAGRYQLLAPTWDAEKKRLGLTDFSPQSQDEAAWDLAQRTYQQKTGRDLAMDSANGQVAWDALAGQWPSLHRMDSDLQHEPQQTMPPGLGPQAVSPTPPGPSVVPAIGSRFGLQMQPVDYDPFTPSLPAPNPLGVPSGPAANS